MYTLKITDRNQVNHKSAKPNWKSWLRTHFLTLILIIAALLILFSKDVKALALRGLLKTGIIGRPHIEVAGTNAAGHPTTPEEKEGSAAGRLSADEEGLAQTKFQDIMGRIFSLDDLKGKVVFLNFWATWCAPCLAEMPGIAVLKAHFKADTNVVFLMVDADGNLDKSSAFLKRKDLNALLTSNSPGGYALVKMLSLVPPGLYTKSIPATFVIDRNGKIVMRYEGAADYSRPVFMSSFQRFVDK